MAQVEGRRHTMCALIAFLLGFCGLYAQTSAQPPASAPQLAVEQFKNRIASYPADEQVYELWRFWLAGQAPDVQKLSSRSPPRQQGSPCTGNNFRPRATQRRKSTASCTSSTKTANAGRSS